MCLCIDRLACHTVAGEVLHVNSRLCYACVTSAGHLEVARCLLEAGASCNEYTYDGERCHYVALTPVIRELLGQYKQKPPPLGRLAKSLRPLSPLGGDPEQASTSQPELSPGTFSDFAFVLQNEHIPLHRCGSPSGVRCCSMTGCLSCSCNIRWQPSSSDLFPAGAAWLLQGASLLRSCAGHTENRISCHLTILHLCLHHPSALSFCCIQLGVGQHVQCTIQLTAGVHLAGPFCRPHVQCFATG